MPSTSISVRDVLGEKNGVITNILMTVILVAGSFFADRILARLDQLNETMNKALTEIAVIQEVNDGQTKDIKKLEAWKESHSDHHNGNH
jgi:hypothetical protein